MLKVLSEETKHRIRSGVTITSYAQCVEELLLNAIDADSTCIAVRVDLVSKKLQIVDNGKGIVKDELVDLGERYHTSKCSSLSDIDDKLQHYGFRGEALASIKNVCYLFDIETRARGVPYTYNKIFRQGIPNEISESKTQRPSVGTTFTVFDLFHSMPVRNKTLNQSLELERIRQRVEAAALIHPQISISLKNEINGNRIVQTHKANSVLGAFKHLYGTTKSRLLCEVKSELDEYKMKGFISKDGNSNKNLQFIYINERLVLKTKIHKLVNMLMGKTVVLKKKGFYNRPDAPAKWSPGNTTEDVGPSKNTERHAVYVLDIQCPLSCYDITFDPAKTLVEFTDWEGLLKCVELGVKTFIDQESLMPVTNELVNLSPIVNTVLSNSGNNNSQDDEINTQSVSLNFPTVYGKTIATHDRAHSLQSEVVKRSESGKDSHPNLKSGIRNLSSFARDSENSKMQEFNSLKENGNRKEIVIVENEDIDEKSIPGGVLTQAYLQQKEKKSTSVNTSKSMHSHRNKLDDTTYSSMRNKVSQFHQFGSLSRKRKNQNLNICNTITESCYRSDSGGIMQKMSKSGDPWDEFLRFSNESTDGEQEAVCSNSRTGEKIEGSVDGNIPSSLIDDKYLFATSSETGMSDNDLDKTPSPRRRDKTFVSLPSPNPTASTSSCSFYKSQFRKTKAFSPLQRVQNKYNLLYHGKKKTPLKKQISSKNSKQSKSKLSNKVNGITSNQKVKLTGLSKKDVVSGTENLDNTSKPQVQSVVSDFSDEDPLSSIQSYKNHYSTHQEISSPENADTPSCSLSNTKTVIDRLKDLKKSPVRTYLTPLQRIRERLLAKSHAQKSIRNLSESDVKDTAGKQVFKKHADVSKHKKSPSKGLNISLENREFSVLKRNNEFQTCLAKESDESVETALDLFKTPPNVLNDNQTTMKYESEKSYESKQQSVKPTMSNTLFDGSSYSRDKQSSSLSLSKKLLKLSKTSDSCKDCITSNVKFYENKSKLSSLLNKEWEKFPELMTEFTDNSNNNFCSTNEIFNHEENVCVSKPAYPLLSKSTDSVSVEAITVQEKVDNVAPLGLHNLVHSIEQLLENNTDEVEMNINEAERSTNEVEMNINEVEMSTNEVEMNINEVEMNTNDVKMNIKTVGPEPKDVHMQTSHLPSAINTNNKPFDKNKSNKITKTLDYDIEFTPLVISDAGKDFTQNMQIEESHKISKTQEKITDPQQQHIKQISKDTSDQINESQGFDVVNLSETQSFTPCIIDESKTFHATKYEVISQTACNSEIQSCTENGGTAEMHQLSCDTEDTNKGQENVNVQHKEISHVESEKSQVEIFDNEDTYLDHNWICKVDPRTGSKLYINVKTGHSSINRPEISNYDIKTKKGSDDVSITQLFERWDNPMFKQPSSNALSIETSDTKNYAKSTLDSIRFDKKMLQDVQVLNQIDNKFIACIMRKPKCNENTDNENILVVIDQHAAHERIRLEQFTQDLYFDYDTKNALKSSSISPPLKVCTTEDVVRMVTAYADYFAKIGIKFNVADRDTISVNAVPSCFVQEQVDPNKGQDTSFLLRQIQLLIREQVDVLERTHGSNASLPKTIHNVLCSRACHGAIKFGDPLLPKECEELVAKLRKCNLPFQCAHGRPSIMPLIDVAKVEMSQDKIADPPKLWKLKRI